MDFNFIKKNNVTYVKLAGQFTFVDHQKFKHILDLIEEQQISRLELDFSEVTFIDSAGLGMMLLLRDNCQNKNIEICVSAATGQVEKIFIISKFDQLFSMQKTSSGK